MVRPGPGRVALLAVIAALDILAGHPETSYHVALATGLFALPQGNLQTLRLVGSQSGFALQNGPLQGQVKWRITRFGSQ